MYYVINALMHYGGKPMPMYLAVGEDNYKKDPFNLQIWLLNFGNHVLALL